ncbi:histone-like nucleoid-structuring protein Lsr2 [Nocardiopsis ansamitocini]|uniref:Lsr2 family protein n=1 Tax=Nocardiopsis ansamitocini TaxID=1670832 RepID=A0A9W6P5D3_9ACTN|nr:Lsr2 family protein [Nocardiopsis ansamitocini]GLU47383.1 Lsr2 family protein [Nocardiopsis ansamitocini]
MAQKVQVLLVDDLDGGEAEETVSFAVDGSTYEIDLSGDNANKLRGALAPFVDAARKAPGKAGRAARGTKQRNAPSRERSAEIRAWAKAAGKQVNERGRIPQSIMDEYHAAQR